MADADADAPDPWRDPRLKPSPNYSFESSFFTASVHHGGEWIITPAGKRDYVGGIVSCFDHCDWDYFSTLDLDRLMVLIGRQNNIGYWWTPLGCSVDEGSELRTDADCLRMFGDLMDRGYRDCDIYVMRALRAIGPEEFALLPLPEPVVNNRDSNETSKDEVISQEGKEVNSEEGKEVNAQEVEQEADDEFEESDPEYEAQSESEGDSEEYNYWAYEHAEAYDILCEDEDEAHQQAQETQEEVPDEGQDELLEQEYALDEEEVQGFGVNPNPPNWWPNEEEAQGFGMNPNGRMAYDSDGEMPLDESDLESVHEDSDGEPRVNRRTRTFTPGRPWSEFKFTLGLEFVSVEQLRVALKEHFIHINRSFIWLENNRVKIRAKCKSPQCGWVIYARVQRRDNTTFRVNTLVNKHNCGIVFNSRHVNSEWLANNFLDQFKMNPDMQFRHFRQLVTNTKYSHCSQSMFYSVKKRAMELLEGNAAEQFAKLEDYCLQLRELMPGSTAIVKSELVNDERVFQRVYICLQACKSGFRHCRKLIGLDGCFLKGKSRGILLAAVGVDADNSMFPIAYAVCEKEKTETWAWFLSLLKEDLEADNPMNFTFISDKQKGLGIAEENVFDGAEIRFCVRHLHVNFALLFPGLILKQKLWGAARATTPEDFTRKMTELRSIDEAAYDWLMAKRPSQWTKSHFRAQNKCDMLVNNMCESFNSVILEGRDNPIITMLEFIRVWLMKRFYKKMVSVPRWIAPVGQRILKILEKNKEEARNCLSVQADQYLFQVNKGHSESFVVNLVARTCTCRGLQLTGIPCAHVISAIWGAQMNIYDYVADEYKILAFVNQYAGVITPVPSPDKWPRAGMSVILPPKFTVLPGRPKKRRTRSAGEPARGATKTSRIGQINCCRNCGVRGHTRRTCTNPTSNQPKIPKKMGRPLKAVVTPATLKRRERRAAQRAKQVSEASSSQATTQAAPSQATPPPPPSQAN